MRYIIYGAGAVGSVIGGRLFQAGRDVVLITRGEHLSTIRQHGLTLKTPTRNFELSIPTVGHPVEIQFREDDVVFLTVKSQHSEQAQRDLYAAAGSQIPVVCAQNGVDNERRALRRFERVYGMLVRLPATYLEPGVVLNHASPRGGVLDIGLYPKGIDDLAKRIANELDICVTPCKRSVGLMHPTRTSLKCYGMKPWLAFTRQKLNSPLMMR